jgi:hypothetical protein
MDRTLEDLWESAPRIETRFDPAAIARHPEVAKRFLLSTITPGARLARAVRLHMRGEIKLAGAWSPFSAEQVIRWDRGLVWRARVRARSLPISGSDRWVDGEGSMRWKLLGIVPIVTGSGPDVTRSSAGRLDAESIWLPTVLVDESIRFADLDHDRTVARIDAHGIESHLELAVEPTGALRSGWVDRWGNPTGERFELGACGVLAVEREVFEGITIPTRVRVGWHFGTPRFESEGEFFRATVESATFR